MGASSAIKVLIGLVRIKIVAIVLGPAGVGLVGLYVQLMATATTITALGLGTVGTRQIAEANSRGDADAARSARSALFWGTLMLAAIGATALYLARSPIAHGLLGTGTDPSIVAWLALGVALNVASGSQVAFLTGMRRIGDIARVDGPDFYLQHACRRHSRPCLR